jgi:hypothetical protein
MIVKLYVFVNYMEMLVVSNSNRILLITFIRSMLKRFPLSRMGNLEWIHSNIN